VRSLREALWHMGEGFGLRVVGVKKSVADIWRWGVWYGNTTTCSFFVLVDSGQMQGIHSRGRHEGWLSRPKQFVMVITLFVS